MYPGRWFIVVISIVRCTSGGSGIGLTIDHPTSGGSGPPRNRELNVRRQPSKPEKLVPACLAFAPSQ
jgi:hypothetical protein